MNRTLLIVPLLALTGCANYPASTIEQQTPAAHLRIARAPLGAAVTVDGRPAGYRSDKKFDLIEISPGRHIVQVSDGGRVLSSKEYFIGVGSTVEIGAPE